MRLLSIILVAAVLLGAGTLPRATVTPGSWQGYCVVGGWLCGGIAIVAAVDKALMRLSR
tara:strand:- start:54 stop:230 length:177 start_codon:yes stop_codon:yes gene_type:complete